MDPNCPLDYKWLAQSTEQRGMWDQAVAELNRARIVVGDPVAVVSELGYVLAASGNKADSEKVLGTPSQDCQVSYRSF